MKNLILFLDWFNTDTNKWKFITLAFLTNQYPSPLLPQIRRAIIISLLLLLIKTRTLVPFINTLYPTQTHPTPIHIIHGEAIFDFKQGLPGMARH